MSDRTESAAARQLSGVRAWWVLLALLAGLGAGVLARGLAEGVLDSAVETATFVGNLWLDALKMTVIPLIVALLVTGIAQGAEAARAGRLAGRSILWFVIICTLSAIVGALVMPALLGLFPLGSASAEALRAGLATLDPAATGGEIPSVADFFRNIVPANVVAAAAEGQVLQLVVFAMLFALAATRLDVERRRTLVGFFDAVADALLVVIGWVLWVAPVGIGALGFAVGAAAGGRAFAGLAHYIVLISLLGIIIALVGYVVAIVAGRVRPTLFVRSMIPPQAVAISTQSSLASLPAMLAAARLVGVSHRTADVTLPLAVALFRATGPAMNIGVAIYVAHWLGTDIGAAELIAATAVAAVASYGAVSLPGQVSFFTSIAPIALAMGVPVAPLGLLIAVEMIPDIFRTVGNVTLDVAVASAVDRRSTEDAAEQGTPAAP